MYHIDGHVYLGTCHGAANRELFEKNGICVVINLSAGGSRLPNYFESLGYQYVHIELTDELVSHPGQAIPRACRFIQKWGAEGKHVLVHCQAGLSRSVAVTVAWLMTQRGHSLASAVALVTEKRTRRPLCNPSFWCYLASLERELRGWPAGTPPSFDFTDWLVQDVNHLNVAPEKIREVLEKEADWVSFELFYIGLSGTGMRKLMAAQRISQKQDVNMATAQLALDCALELLEVYHAWPAVQSYCLRILQQIVFHPNGRVFASILKSGGAGKGLTAMRGALENADLQEAGIGFLAYFASRDCPGAKEIVLLGGFEDIVKAMVAHKDFAALQATGCAALHVLLVGGTTGDQAVAAKAKAQAKEHNALRLVTSAMYAHKDSPQVQAYGSAVLVQLAGDRKVGNDLKPDELEHALGAVRGAVQAYPSDASVQEHGREVMAILTVLAESSKVKAGLKAPRRRKDRCRSEFGGKKGIPAGMAELHGA